jgi:hypothetical protein
MRFLDHIVSHEKVWGPIRLQIAQHRHAHHMELAAKGWDIA